MIKKLAYLFIVVLAACQSTGVEKTKDGVIVRLNPKTKEGTRMVQLRVVSDKIIHVQATASSSFSKDTSLMTLNEEASGVDFAVEQLNDSMILKTKKLHAYVSVKTGEIRFADTLGNTILNEETGRGKTFTPTEVDGESFFEVRQLFQSPSDEAFYGLGQNQDAQMNYKGKNVELFQFNSKVAIPFVVSNKNYGVLWDNYSLSRFGDPRDYKSLKTLKTYDKNGNPGGLMATYRSASDTSKVFVSRQEEVIDYEFIPSLKKFPAMFPMGQGLVDWDGFLESDTTGEHQFSFYSAGYTKVWLNGKLVANSWRQAWNPRSSYFSLSMKKGERYPIRIEWNPDGGESYIGLRCLTPQQGDDQQKFSMYSEVAKQIDYYFIKGENIDDVIKGYRTVTGKAPMMPKWAMGFWQSRERYKTQDELLGAIAEYRKRNIPFDNIVMDWFYWPENRWGDHNFDSTRFANPVQMMKDIHEKYNAHIMISVWPKFYEESENYKKFNVKGWVYTNNIKEKRRDWVGPGYASTFYDPYSPGARKLFWELINEKLFSKGIDAWWMDASEPDIHSNMPVEARKEMMNPTACGSAAQYFNAFPLMNAKGIYEGQRNTAPDQRVFILTRSAYAGQQRYAAATWSGDIGARWEEMYRQIAAGINFSISGIPYWTMDIGGFAVEKRFEKASGELLEEWRELQTRWYEFGAFCPIFRSHGQFPYREMYNIAPENHPAYKSMVNVGKLRYRLMPYIYSLAGMVHLQDYTIMRALVMDYSSDTCVNGINNQFMFGPSLLVCPVTEYKARERKVYLPKGNGWYNLYSGKFFNGGQTLNAESPLAEMPIFVKEGAIIPFGPEIQYAQEKSDKPIKVFVYTGKDGSFDLYEDENVNYNYEKGFYSVIPFIYNESAKTLTIKDRSGSFAGMDATKKFEIVWIDKGSNTGLDLDKTKGVLVEYTGKELVIKK